MFFDTWGDIGRTILIGCLGYVALVAFLHISGKRTLSKLNAFDLVVTVALGSTLATLLLSKEVSLSEGVTAFIVLITLQYVITWTSRRSETVAGLVKATPSLLFYDGQFVENEMRQNRMMVAEVEATIRGSGFASMSDVVAVVLETDGSLSVIEKTQGTDVSALRGIRGADSLDLDAAS